MPTMPSHARPGGLPALCVRIFSRTEAPAPTDNADELRFDTLLSRVSAPATSPVALVRGGVQDAHAQIERVHPVPPNSRDLQVGPAFLFPDRHPRLLHVRRAGGGRARCPTAETTPSSSIARPMLRDGPLADRHASHSSVDIAPPMRGQVGPSGKRYLPARLSDTTLVFSWPRSSAARRPDAWSGAAPNADRRSGGTFA